MMQARPDGLMLRRVKVFGCILRLHPVISSKLDDTIVLARQPLHPLVLPIVQVLLQVRLPIPIPHQPNLAHLSSQSIIFLIDINPPPILPNPQFLFLGHLLDLSIMAFVAERCGWRQDEGPRHHGKDEREAEEQEWIAVEVLSVERAQGVLVRAWAEFVGLEGWHGDMQLGRK